MPWPFLPPNPDTHPAPHDGDLFVFGLTLTGMRPFDEQADHSFQVDGTASGVYVPIVVDAASFRYTGVCMAPLTQVGSTARYRGTYLPLSKSNEHTVEVDATQLNARITQVTATRSGSKVTLTVGLQTGGASGLWAVAAPYMPQAPKFSSQDTYLAAGAQAAVAASATATKLVVTPGSVARYAVFLARNLPSSMEPASSGKLVKI